jgi:hypothetical protein
MTDTNDTPALDSVSGHHSLIAGLVIAFDEKGSKLLGAAKLFRGLADGSIDPQDRAAIRKVVEDFIDEPIAVSVLMGVIEEEIAGEIIKERTQRRLLAVAGLIEAYLLLDEE